MSKTTPKFPAFVRALQTQEQASELNNQVRDLEGRLASLRMNPDLAPTDAARDFVAKEDGIKSSLREARLALAHADPDASPQWQAAISEMRPAVGEADTALSALLEKAKDAATQALTPLVPNAAAAASQSKVVLAASAILSEFRSVFFAAVNSRPDNIGTNAVALHEALQRVPQESMAIEKLIDAVTAAAASTARLLPAEQA
jgi:hypothetical protein